MFGGYVEGGNGGGDGGGDGVLLVVLRIYSDGRWTGSDGQLLSALRCCLLGR